ncbi:hypothetical protein [Actinomyces trachealis]|uniref:hypothetical protein n=1 Tax=Actinomyces trachealis TaxID=2763540 RepID=UPI001892C20C|nr:hypothetical protein [Actinomyces trachealis]
MKSSTRSGLLVGLVCAGIGAMGYYAINPDLGKALFVGAIGFAISATIFVVMSFMGRDHHNED